MNAMIIPAKITEPICPDTLAATACINKKFWLSSSRAIFCTTRLAIGKAEIPQAPSIGFSLLSFFRNRFKNFAKRTPQTISPTKAIRPRSIIERVWRCKNSFPRIEAPTERPKSKVTMFAISFCADFVIFSKMPLSFIRLPSIKKPISGEACGTIMLTMMVVSIGKAIIFHWEMVRSFVGTLRLRSFFVVRSFMVGGMIIGTRDM